MPLDSLQSVTNHFSKLTAGEAVQEIGLAIHWVMAPRVIASPPWKVMNGFGSLEFPNYVGPLMVHT